MKPIGNAYPGVFTDRGRIYTRNLVPGVKVYEENLVMDDGKEYREWDARRSKLGASILKRVIHSGLGPGDSVLYLGASTGTTVSHVSDIVGRDGVVYAVEFAPRVLRELIFMGERRGNIAPILADANQPFTYAGKVTMADYVFQDIAQRNQAEIFLKNCRLFLKDGGYAMISVKSRSIDISKRPSVIFREVREEIEKELKVLDFRTLEPFQIDHCIFLCRRG